MLENTSSDLTGCDVIFVTDVVPKAQLVTKVSEGNWLFYSFYNPTLVLLSVSHLWI